MPPTVTVTTLTHVAGAHTLCSPAVLVDIALIEDTKASYWLLADLQQPIMVPPQLISLRYRQQSIIEAALCLCVNG